MSIIKNYIVVDDDPWNNNICRFNIKKTLGNIDVTTFSMPEEGLAFIEHEFSKNPQHTILFLDINMPIVNGWAFLDRFKDFSEDIKNHITIYMLSSSINNQDIERAKSNKYVKDFLSKPLMAHKIELVANASIE